MNTPQQEQPREKTLLSSVFNNVVALGVMIACVKLATQVLPEPVTRIATIPRAEIQSLYHKYTADRYTALSPDEAAMAQAIFGPDFKTGNIHKSYFNNKNACGNNHANACTDVSANVRLVEPAYFMHDYGLDGSVAGIRSHMFIHEITHVWQLRQSTPFNSCNKYNLHDSMLEDTSKTFDDYCPEQQGELIGAYYSALLRPTAMAAFIADAPDFSPALWRIRQIVEDKFPHAKTARLRVAKQAQNLRDCVVAASSSAAQDTCLRRYFVSYTGKPLTIPRGEKLDFGQSNIITTPRVKEMSVGKIAS